MDAEPGEGPEQWGTLGIKLPHGLDQAEHPLLHQVLAVTADEKIRAGAGTDQPMIPGG